MQGKTLILALVAAALLAACSTDVDVNAPYKATTVAYGILEPGLDTQFVKINKTWLGDGNNFDIALIRDSSEYPTGAFEGRLEVMQGSNVVQSYPINEIELDNKSPDGIFYSPNHKAYYFVTPGGLNTNRRYRLMLEFPDREVEATTDLISVPVGGIIFPPAGSTNFNLNWGTVNNNNVTVYNNVTFRWTTAPNARRYEASLNIYINEKVYTNASHTTLVEERLRVLEWSLGRVTTDNSVGGSTVNLPANGESLANFIRGRFAVDPNVKRELGVWDPVGQHAKVFDFVLTIANEDFNTFLDVNEPITNIVQERPSYTNVVNGLGVWASRASDRINGLGATEGAVRMLVQGPITQPLNICSANPFNQFYCGD